MLSVSLTPKASLFQTPWHHDGRTFWTADGEPLAPCDAPTGAGQSHGSNISICVSEATPESCLWVCPASQRRRRVPPAAGERVADAVPAVLRQGDAVIVNRSSMHGAFANRTPARRATLILQYNSRASALGACDPRNSQSMHRPGESPDAEPPHPPPDQLPEHLARRARMVALAIDSRRQRFPAERPFVYRGEYTGAGRWDEQSRAEITRPGDEYFRYNVTL